ncbi:hypothetical protein, partial [Xanthomonas translucens]|uniref:hypothetical protein n=1 Tax=Xanthomonas campestris pv. translucens TaxID=343 RepID=UPI001E65BD78
MKISFGMKRQRLHPSVRGHRSGHGMGGMPAASAAAAEISPRWRGAIVWPPQRWATFGYANQRARRDRWPRPVPVRDRRQPRAA